MWKNIVLLFGIDDGCSGSVGSNVKFVWRQGITGRTHLYEATGQHDEQCREIFLLYVAKTADARCQGK